MPFPQGHALIIGVGSYANSPEHHVPTTAADARAVAELVQDPAFCGYPPDQITLLCEAHATRESVLAGLAALTQTGPDDTVLLFYSGHGEFAGDGSYTLTTHDTQWQQGRVVSGSALGHAELLQYLQDIPAGRVLLIFNACHAGLLSPTLGDEASPTGHALPGQTARALLATGSGRIVISACRENQKSFVGNGEQTLFARALTQGLRGEGDMLSRNGYISAFDLYAHLYYALPEAVQREVPQHIRELYGNTQEPEISVLKGVGPFAVALFRGANMLGELPEHTLPAEAAVNVVSEERSRRALQGIIGTATVQGDNYGQNVGVNTGTMNQHRQEIHNTAPNQGAQGHFAGPVTFNQPRTHVQGDYVGGDKVGGDKIDASGSQGFVNRPSGPVSMQFGAGPADEAADLGSAFARIYAAIADRPADPDVDRDEILETVHNIQEEAQKGIQANAKKLRRWLGNLADIAADIFGETVDVLSGPQATSATVVRNVALQVKQEHKQG